MEEMIFEHLNIFNEKCVDIFTYMYVSSPSLCAYFPLMYDLSKISERKMSDIHSIAIKG